MDRRGLLSRLLGGHEPADATEARNLSGMLRLLAAAGDPFSRERFEPGHFTASGFVLSPDRGSVVLIHHGRLERWLQPGGHVEPADPDLAAAARREVQEETGLVGLEAALDGCPLDVDVHAIPPAGTAPEHLHFDVRFLFRARETGLRPASDAKEARWIAVEQLAPFTSTASMQRIAHKLAGTRHRGEP